MKIDRLRLLGGFGTNKIMQGELSRLTRRALSGERSRELLERPPLKVGPGGLSYPYAHDLASVAVTYHRTSARVLWDVAQSAERRLEPLYEELYEDFTRDERPWLTSGGRLSVLAFDTRSVEAGERQVVGVVKNAVLDAARARGHEWRVDADSPDLVLHARSVPLAEEEAASGGAPGTLTVSLDLAGRPMHQRGYRLSHGEAPLREDLAAALVMLARHDAKQEVLVDPMAGSGTLLIEAALLAQARSIWPEGTTPLGARLPGLAAELALRPASLFGDTAPRLFGAELDGPTADHLESNAARAGVWDAIQLHRGDFRAWDVAALSSGGPGLVLSNPPYGERLDVPRDELRQLYADLGAFCRQLGRQNPGWRAAFVIGDVKESDRGSSVGLFLRAFGGRPRIEKPLSNGPLRAKFLLYDL